MTEPTDANTGEADASQEATLPPAAAADYEGPRRRARREREERRAAQARATAIEQARREAKRRVMGGPPDETKRLGRRTVRGLKVLMWSALMSVVVVGLGLLLYFTPIMSARNIVVIGLGAVTQDEVIGAAAIKPGTPLLQVDTDAVAERVAAIRRVASARVQRQYPSTLRVTVIERVPVVVKDYPDGPHLFDKDGVDFATAPPPAGVPYLDADNPGPSDAADQGRAAGDDGAAPRGRRAGRPHRGAVGRRHHPDLDRWPGSGVGDHRPHRGKGAQAGRAADPAGPDLRRVQPGSADGEVGPATPV